MSLAALIESLVGTAAVVAGVAMIHVPSAFIVAGVSLVGLAVFTERRS